ncbi:MAG: nitronate monooxygenase family protein [Lachnospiraceae bacterium]|jgi:nitronate monooxygenase|nr:nitronate monooxygenase family protein [Lachnospiraceae bacterium]
MDIKSLKIGELTARLPVIQGGMGVGISLSGLAGAVAAGGGVGVISTAQIGYREPEFETSPMEANLKAIGKEIERARKLAKGGVLGVNIMVATRQYAEYVKAAVKAGIDLIISGAGLPTMLPELVKGSSTKIAPIVSTIKSAQVICKFWDRKHKRVPDLVVIEGPRAGGHLGFSREQLEQFTTETYEEEIVGILEVVDTYAQKYERHIPVVVAGGIYDRSDLEHVLALGADGVQMGTRFVTTYECDASEAYKQTYLDCRQEDIRIVDSPVGLPGRAISNPFLSEAKGCGVTGKCYKCLERCNPSKIPYCITRALVNAVKGNTDQGLLFCGDNAWRAHRLEHVADILKEME